MTAGLLVVISIIAYLVYLAIATLLLRATESTRIELSKLGDELIDRPDIGDSLKRVIVKLIDAVFSWQFIFGLIIRIAWKAVKIKQHQITDAERKFISDSKVENFLKLHFKATAAANPIWAVVLFAVLIPVSIILVFRFSIIQYGAIWLDALKVSPVIAKL